MILVTWGGIDPDTGEPWSYGAPNLRWGSPSYALTRGDYGYQPPASELSPNQTKKPKMKHNDYYPLRVGDQIIWLSNFYHKLATWAGTLGVDAPTQAEIVADCRWLIYLLQDWLPAVRAHNLAATAAAKSALLGNGGLIALPVFTPPPLPGPEGTFPAVVPRAEGGLARLFDVIAEWKENNACTNALCLDLGIIGSVQNGPNLATVQPEIDGGRNGIKVDLDWGWQGYSKWLDAIQFEVNRGAGWVALLTDTSPGCSDNHPQPAEPAIWKYRAWFLVDGERVGLVSNELSVVVGGP